MALRPRRSPRGGVSPRYRAVLVLLAVLAAGLGVQAAATRLLARRAPDLALRFSSTDAIALSIKANAVLANGEPARLMEARALARRALKRDLTRDDALVIMAVTGNGAGAEQRGTRLVRQAESLSRRTLATQLWLIEDAVSHGNVRGALGHFDVALRTSKNSGGLLFPVLRNALEESQLTGPIARTLNAAPWAGSFLQYAVSLNRPTGALAAVMAAQNGLAPFQGTDLKGALVAQLVSAKSYDTAARLALGGAAGLVRDPGFAEEGGYAPFAWQLSDDVGLVARRLREGAASQLQVKADEGATGPVATQLIAAKPGRYLLSGRMATAASGLAIRLACVNDDRELTRIALTRTATTGVSVPTACPYQMLSVLVTAEDQDQGRGDWRLTRVDLTPDHGE